MSVLFTLSLGLCLSIGLLLLTYRKCERRLDSSAWSWMFNLFAWILLCYLARWVLPGLLTGRGYAFYGLIHIGFPVNPRPRLRELAAGWRPGPLEIFGWVWLIGFALCLLGQLASLLCFWRRVKKESRPASERVQQAMLDASGKLKHGVLDDRVYKLGVRDVVVMPSLSGPASMVLGMRLLLLDREDYDDQTLDAIFRHELVHIYGYSTSLERSTWLVLGALFWFVPTMWLLRREARVREEYTCDREANLGRTMEERRAYAAAMASLAAPRRREAFGTANMACGEATLRRRVEALFRAEPALRWWQKALRRLPAFVVPTCMLIVSVALFSGPAHYAIDEGNLLNFVGHDIFFDLNEGMHPDSFPTLRGEDYNFHRLETKTPPYGAAAVYNERGDIYLSFPDDPAAADEACARLAARLDGFLGARENAGEAAIFIENAALRVMLELPPDAAISRWELLGTWRGTAAPSEQFLGFWRGEAKGTATITLARADAETGAVVALLWGEKVETQPLPFDIEVFIIDTTLQNDSAPSGSE